MKNRTGCEQRDSKSKLSSTVIYDKNPFIDNMIEDIEIKHKTQMIKSTNSKNASMALVSDNGEMVGHAAFMRYVQVDEEKFTKLFASQLGLLGDLNKSSLKVLGYILSNLKPNDDKVYFEAKDCMEYNGWTSNRSMYDGLIGLINVGYIARTDKSYFFYINPKIMFNGSRITLMTTYIKNNSKESEYHQNSLPENTDFINQENDGI